MAQMNILKNKKILITGGTGSIGKALVQKALSSGSKSIKVFSNDENGLYEMELEYDNKNIEFVIGDIRNENTINSLVKGIDIIFHAAALKHVDRCEVHPYETVSVNIIGTHNIIQASLKENVKKVVSISTDKAVNPIGVMGGTKLLAEKLISSEAHKDNKTVFCSVRFGNVLHTRGSILPKIEKQIKKGGPITLTDTRMKRFFMTKEDAVNLILSATEIAKGGETFVLKMPVIRLVDLFEMMKQLLATRYGFNPSKIKTKILGARPGEKLLEDLMNDFEMEHAIETKDFFIIPSLFKKYKITDYPNAKKPKNIRMYFDNLNPLTKGEIMTMLKKVY
jgi:UDP-N-acetylglucosamine 4,6-dehydratase